MHLFIFREVCGGHTHMHLCTTREVYGDHTQMHLFVHGMLITAGMSYTDIVIYRMSVCASACWHVIY